MSKREILCKVISLLGLDKLGAFANQFNPSLKILAYHRILDVDLKKYPYDTELISANSAQFERQVAYLTKHFNVKTLRNAVLNPVSDNGKENIVITFDDGFDDLYFKAFPILKKYNVSATMFISSGYIDTEDYLWTDKLAFHLKSNLDKRLTLIPYFKDVPIGDETGSCTQLLGRILRILKQVPNSEREILYHRVCDQLPIDSRSDTKNKMLTWEMVKEMSDYGIEFGSHTVTHPILTRLEGDQLKHELEESKRTIEAHTHVECCSIAYPVGGIESFDTRVKKMSELIGYTIGCSYVSGVNPVASMEPLSLKRLHVEHYTSFDQFKAQIAFAELCGYQTPH